MLFSRVLFIVMLIVCYFVVPLVPADITSTENTTPADTPPFGDTPIHDADLANYPAINNDDDSQLKGDVKRYPHCATV